MPSAGDEPAALISQATVVPFFDTPVKSRLRRDARIFDRQLCDPWNRTLYYLHVYSK